MRNEKCGRFVVGLLMVWVMSVGVAGALADRPNVLFLLSDDQRPDTLGVMGGGVIRTPHLDRLARRGAMFTRAVSNHPLCVPIRAEILTGCSGFTNGIMPGYTNTFNEDLKLWPEVMREAGYRTVYVGKWHTAGRPSTRGYDESMGLYSGGMGSKAPVQYDFKEMVVTGYKGWVFQTDDRKRMFPEKGIGLTPDISALFADAAIELIERESDEPFFLHVNFTAPHDPLLVPPGDAYAYELDEIKAPRNFMAYHPFDHGNYEGRDEQMLPWPRTKKAVRENLAVYYAVISHLDAQVGRVMEALKKAGKLENTIVIYAADHGLAVGSHGLMGKQNMYEHTVNVPLILAGPGVPKGETFGAQVYLRDLYPTVCDLVGAEIPGSVEGLSFKGVLDGGVDEVREAAFAYFKDVQRMIRTDRWKLIYYPQIEKWQLFDMENDGDELEDLIGVEAYAGVVEELKGRMRAAQRGVGDLLVE